MKTKWFRAYWTHCWCWGRHLFLSSFVGVWCCLGLFQCTKMCEKSKSTIFSYYENLVVLRVLDTLLVLGETSVSSFGVWASFVRVWPRKWHHRALKRSHMGVVETKERGLMKKKNTYFFNVSSCCILFVFWSGYLPGVATTDGGSMKRQTADSVAVIAMMMMMEMMTTILAW